MLIIVSGVAVDLLRDAFNGRIREVLTTDIGADANVSVFAALIITFEFDMPKTTSEEFCCCAAFDCRPMAALDRGGVLQAWMPSYHV